MNFQWDARTRCPDADVAAGWKRVALRCRTHREGRDAKCQSHHLPVHGSLVLSPISALRLVCQSNRSSHRISLYLSVRTPLPKRNGVCRISKHRSYSKVISEGQLWLHCRRRRLPGSNRWSGNSIRRRKELSQEGFKRSYLIWRKSLLQEGNLGIDVRFPLHSQRLQLIEARRRWSCTPNRCGLRVQVLYLGSQPHRGSTNRRIVRVGQSQYVL